MGNKSKKAVESKQVKSKDPVDKPNVEKLADAVLSMGTQIDVAHFTGHSGLGFYAWNTEYADEGCVFITTDADVLAKVLGVVATRASEWQDQLITMLPKAEA